MASTAVQLSLFPLDTASAARCARSQQGPSAEFWQERGEGQEPARQGCPLGSNRCAKFPPDCELWPSICF